MEMYKIKNCKQYNIACCECLKGSGKSGMFFCSRFFAKAKILSIGKYLQLQQFRQT